MKYRINPDIYYGRYGEYTYVRDVRDRMDYLYNEICFDVLEAVKAGDGCTPEQAADYLSGIYRRIPWKRCAPT